MEDNNEKSCRFCWEEEGDLPEEKFISPCKCKNGIGYVHIKCLNNLFTVNKGTDTYYRCKTCNGRYLRSEPEDAKDIINRKTLLTVLWAESGLFLLLLLMILFISNSNTFCSIAIFIFYIITLCYIIGNNYSQDYYYFIYVLLFAAVLSSGNSKKCITNLWGIFIFSFIAFNIIIYEWDNIRDNVKKQYLSEFKAKMYDYVKNVWIDGVI
jgi:hypothetical protein